MTFDEFANRVARLEEHLVGPTAEEELEKAERLFATQGNNVWAQCALLRAKSIRSRVAQENGWEDEDDA